MFSLSRPLNLLLAALTYLLGAGIAKYLGQSFAFDSFGFGLFSVVIAQLSMSFVAEIFRPENEPILENETRADRLLLRNNLLVVSAALLGTNAVIAVVLLLQRNLSAFSFLFASFILVIAYAVPPFRLVNRGVGEFLLATHIAYVIPSIGFFLQTRTYHFLLSALILPLTLIALAYFLILAFESFATDQKYQRLTMLRLLAWERAVPLHHSLVVGAYILFFTAAYVLSVNVLWRVFLTLPFAAFQIVQLRAIARGIRPNWKALNINAFALFSLVVYSLTVSLWLR